ncbi:MAG: MobA/MobL family protein, partial [Lachnospiraceae bacterium]|nr:MobA/MobL family protein [Lachnospiraceae bacterium]
TRNMFYDEQGKHVRTKKEILDENGDVRKGCKIVKKGEVYEHNLFTAKNKLFKQDEFIDEVKHFYTDLINTLVKDGKEKLHVFDENGLYLATKKIGKNNPKAEQIQTDNEYRMRWNREVDRAIVSGMAETEIQQIKKEYISDRIRESVDVFGNQLERLGTILMSAVAVLAMLISKVLQKAREMSAKLYDTEQIQPQMPVQGPVCQPAEKETQTKPKIPPKPVMPAEAAAYPKLFKIYKELKRQNEIIFEAEKERNALEFERDDLKGLARFTKKGELQSKIDSKNEEIDILKIRLSGIAKKYGYQNVQEFYCTYHKSHSAYIAYKEQAAEWEQTCGDDNQKQNNKSVLGRLKNPPKRTADYQQQRTLKGKDRGAR